MAASVRLCHYLATEPVKARGRLLGAVGIGRCSLDARHFGIRSATSNGTVSAAVWGGRRPAPAARAVWPARVVLVAVLYPRGRGANQAADPAARLATVIGLEVRGSNAEPPLERLLPG
ncbi:MAG TPA: hypothetical protein VMW80_01615 [Candidatus Dormibacteraeota bacterium]|nr:hypothetical protein [Candidatus Dormibacteraeota bacterium]